MSLSLKSVSRALFELITQRGRKAHRPLLSLTTHPTKEAQHHFSFVISKKVLNRAAGRNRLKRQGRAIVHDLLATISEPCSGIFFFKKGAETLSFQELQDEIKQLLQKTGVIDKSNV